MRLTWLFLFCIISMPLFSQNDITVEVLNVPSPEGKISVALYDKEDTFLKFESVYAFASSNAKKGMTQIFLKEIPDGRYAIAIFHDKNGNDELDTNWIGIPKEKVAFSNAKMKLFGPPSFQECAFELSFDKTVVIGL